MGLSHRSAAKRTDEINAEHDQKPKLVKRRSFKEWIQRKRSFTDLFESEGFAHFKKQWGSFKRTGDESGPFESNPGPSNGTESKPGPSDGKLKRTESKPVRGRAALDNIIVKEETSIFHHVYDSYIYLLRLPAPLFTFYCILAPFLVALLFTFVYCLDLEGFVAHGEQRSGASLLELSLGKAPQLGWWDILFEVYLFSLSLSTTFGDSRLDARSPFCLLVANVNTLMAQLMFVFLSGAVFSRLAQPSQPVKISSVAIITDDFFEGEGLESESSDKTYKILMTRLVLTGPASHLIDAKLDLVYRHMVQLPGGSPFMSTHSLKLVRAESPSLVTIRGVALDILIGRGWLVVRCHEFTLRALVRPPLMKHGPSTDFVFWDVSGREKPERTALAVQGGTPLSFLSTGHENSCLSKKSAERRVLKMPNRLAFQASSLRYGLLIRHVITEESPLFGACARNQLLAEDANFQLTVMATERSSMQPVFADQMFFVADSEVIWNAQFVDIINIVKGQRTMDHRKLSAYRKDGTVFYHVGGK